MILINILLFILLSPGLVFNIFSVSPGSGFWDMPNGHGEYLFTGKTSFISILAAAIVFYILATLLGSITENFNEFPGNCWNECSKLSSQENESELDCVNKCGSKWRKSYSNPKL